MKTSHTSHTPLGELVVGVDGTPQSFAALQWAMRLSSVTGQSVHAVYGWTHSWDLGDEPVSTDEWERVRKLIVTELHQWAETASHGLDFDPALLKLTPVHAAGTTALVEIGAHAHQIVVGRRSMKALARWFFGSTAESLIDQSTAPITVVRTDTHDEDLAESKEDIPHTHSNFTQSSESYILGSDFKLPIVVGIDGSQSSNRALDFAIEAAQLEQRDLHIVHCWQNHTLEDIVKDLQIKHSSADKQQIASHFIQTIIEQANIPTNVAVHSHVVEAPAHQGLYEASRFAHRVIVGSRGLGEIDTQTLGTVPRKLLDTSLAPVTIIH